MKTHAVSSARMAWASHSTISFGEDGDTWTLLIEDARWRWAHAEISGSYNLRDERGKLVTGVSLVTDEMTERLEGRIDELVRAHPLPNAFIVPGANPASACLDVARGVIRRAERRVVAIGGSGGEVNDAVLRYLNRLSDLVFVLARIAAGEVEPASR